jgi:hypothetical protein
MEETTTPVDQAAEELRRSRSDTLETIELLRSSRVKVEEQSNLLESPKAVLEYIDFFVEMFSAAAGEIERLVSGLSAGPSRAHVDALRQIASNSSVEQRRCLMFRDKWINKPLPYEEMRRLLNQISVDSRDQLTAYRNLNNVAERLEVLTGPPPKPAADGKLDRRALFTRWFGK